MAETSEPSTLPWPQRAAAYFVYLCVRAIEGVVLSLTPDAADGMAKFAGEAWYRLDRHRRRTAFENMRIVFGDAFVGPTRDRLARRAFEHVFLVGIEAIRRYRVLRTQRDFHRRVRYLRDTWDFIHSIGQEKSGVLLAGHVGNWELLAAVARAEDVPISFVARAFGNPYLDRHVSNSRGGPDAIIFKDGAVRAVRRALDQGRWGGIVADQNAGMHGVYVDFFGIPASTYSFAASLAVREERPVIFTAAVRRGRGFRYDLILERYRTPPTGDVDEDVRRCLLAFHAFLEGLVRDYPEQYFWLHRRWRTRPLGEVWHSRLPRYKHRGTERPGAVIPAEPPVPYRED